MAIEYYIEGYNTDNMAVNALEQALQISIAINNFNKAEKVCELLLIEQPENIKIVQTIIDLSLFNKNYDLSLKMLNKLEKINGVSPEIAIQKSVIYQEIQDQEEALNVLLELVEIDSQNIDILDRIVNLLIEQKNISQALVYNEQIIQNYAEDPRGYINNAIIEFGNSVRSILVLFHQKEPSNLVLPGPCYVVLELLGIYVRNSHMKYMIN